MERISRVWAAVVTGFLATVLIPATAWAEESGVADIVRKKKSSFGFGGIIPIVCCLVVVAIIVVAVVLVMRSRKK
ncbi:hypothetical protein [Catellatospora methionotrophica]|uniref:hypothetical protein n=1 Tax=Catellatospora methionotrophica TaxID=121620 RepID=UPI0033FA20C9